MSIFTIDVGHCVVDACGSQRNQSLFGTVMSAFSRAPYSRHNSVVAASAKLSPSNSLTPDGGEVVSAAVRRRRPEPVAAPAVDARPVVVVPQRRLRGHVANAAAGDVLRRRPAVPEQFAAAVFDRQLAADQSSEVIA